MSIISQMTAGKKYNINGTVLEFKSLHVDKDVESMMGEGKEVPVSEQIPIMKRLVKRMLKDAVPDVTDEELEDAMRIRTLLPLMNAFYDICGLTDEKNISNLEKVKSAIEQRREAIAKKGKA
ncbi:hypothetical protein LCGC14_3153070 [marine sediment metagenome]|uniref:Uncharacterized protein n=1 Tax=marine sediment metagenome TaxID=412755 RepID=A0A0F8Y087_9ZZZZ